MLGKGCPWLDSQLGTEGLVAVFKYRALLQCLTIGAPLALAPSTAFMGIPGCLKKKKKTNLIAAGLPRVNQRESVCVIFGTACAIIRMLCWPGS